MLVYPSAIDLSTRTLTFLAELLAAHRHAIGSRWRKLPAGQQALLVLAHLRCGDTYARLAAGFGVGVATAYRYIREAVELLATLAPTRGDAVRAAAAKAYVIATARCCRSTGSPPTGPTTPANTSGTA